jgi:predicted AlkP superfamily phosphohydrolase/phosphomutase
MLVEEAKMVQHRGTSRVLVIGIDAATMDLIRPWAEAGRLPTFASLLKQGTSGLLRSVPNRNSAAAWSSMMTGKNPGKHGIFFFTEYQEGSFDYSYVNASYRDGATLWRLLSEAGLQVGVINVPMTYPAEEVNGFMISGMDAPGAHDPRFVYPRELYREIRSRVGEYTIETGLGSYMKAGKLADGAQALLRTTRRRLAATRYLMTTRPWDFFMVVFRATDPAQHYFWKYMEPQSFRVNPRDVERYGQVIPSVYEEIDRSVGELLALAGEDTTVMIVSDHGASADTAKAKVLNRWLEAMGMLRFQEAPRRSPVERMRKFSWDLATLGYRQMDKRFSRAFKKRLAHMFPRLRAKTEAHMAYSRIDWSATRAFSDGKRAEIWINVKGRQPHGIVEPGEEFGRVCREIISRLYAIRDASSGRPLVQRVYRRDEVYHGPHVDRSTDLIIEWQKNAVTDRVDFGGGDVLTLDRERAENPLERLICGAHDPMGVLFMAGPPVRCGHTVEGATVMDITPTVLYLLGQPIPDDMDGGPILDALRDDYLASHPPRDTRAREAEPVASVSAYSEDDEARIGERLRGLGYIE